MFAERWYGNKWEEVTVTLFQVKQFTYLSPRQKKTWQSMCKHLVSHFLRFDQPIFGSGLPE
jgi:hypothetical protein